MNQKVREKALSLLKNREHTRKELLNKLRHISQDNELIDTELAQLEQQGLLSDERFTEQYIRMRSGRGYGPQHIENDLRQRGVDQDIINNYLQLDDESFWLELLEKAWQKRFHGQYPKNINERAKQIRFLSYRGFYSEQIRTFLEKIEA